MLPKCYTNHLDSAVGTFCKTISWWVAVGSFLFIEAPYALRHFSSGARTNNAGGLPTREYATIYRGRNICFLDSATNTQGFLPCDLLIVMANARRIGN